MRQKKNPEAQTKKVSASKKAEAGKKQRAAAAGQAAGHESKYMLQVIDFSKKYRHNERYSARHVNFTVSAGEVVGLVGSNGAGKSTIIKSVIGVLPFTEGAVKVGGYDIARQPEEAKRLIGYVPDDHSVYEKLTGREYINYIGSLYGATKEEKKYVTEELAKRFEIAYALDTQIAWNLPSGLRSPMRTVCGRRSAFWARSRTDPNFGSSMNPWWASTIRRWRSSASISAAMRMGSTPFSFRRTTWRSSKRRAIKSYSSSMERWRTSSISPRKPISI